MKNLPINIPKPSKFIKHHVIDNIANEVNKLYRNQMNDSSGKVADIERFIDNYLRINILREEILEPNNRVCFAKLSSKNGEYTITLNDNHRSLFESKPFLLLSSLSHEVGHYVLNHFEDIFVDDIQMSLFGSEEKQPQYLHDSGWNLGLSSKDFLDLKNRLAKNLWNNEQHRRILENLDDRIEPKWMYLQAEQFASCFLVPKDKLYELLNEGLDLTIWENLYSLKDTFGVSITMVVVRLEKLGLIKVQNKQITLTDFSKQNTIFN